MSSCRQPGPGFRWGWHWHWLAWQVRPDPEQGMPQAPQLFESDAVSTQSEPQAVCPAAQRLVPPVPAVPVPLPELPLGDEAAQAAVKMARKSPKSDTRPVVMKKPTFPQTW